MVTTLTKFGDELALVFDPLVLAELNIDARTPLEITTNGNLLVIIPTNAISDEEFEQALQETTEQYAKALKRLAE